MASIGTYVNGVAKQHGETSRQMFPEVPIHAITNGVHAGTWTCPAFQQLFDRYIPTWREDNFSLRSALGLPAEDVWAAHLIAKHELLEVVRTKTGLHLDSEVFTVGFARRATGYKRADLILSDLDRLRQIAKDAGQFQIIYAGKAHPNDAGGKDIIRRIYKAKKALRKNVPTVFLDDYNLELGGKMTSGVDLWLNTPQFPLEASGTSGMKAALNGVPSLSILDGWWVEGHIEGVTGWSIGEPRRGPGSAAPADNQAEAESLYSKLEHHPAAVLRRAAQVPRSDAARHRHQRLVFQHAAHGTAVHHRRVSALRLLGRSLCAFLRKKNQQRQFLYRAMPTAASMPILSSAAISRLVLMPPAAMIGWCVASRSVRNHFRFAPIMVPSRSTSVHKKPAQ